MQMKVPFNDLYAQYRSIKGEVDQAISSVIQDSAFVYGSYVQQFEANFAKKLGVKHCISCANGTDALYISLKALGVQPGDEVITTAHSWISTSESITHAGGNVVFCDTEYTTFNLDPKFIEAKITEHTRCIVVVHLYGQPAEMDAIMNIAKKHNLFILEDAAQAHLATYKSKYAGTMGVIGIFSFYPGKNLGAMGDAGCIVTNNDKLAEWMALFARHGGKGDHVIEGINSRMDGLQGAILNVKLPYLSEWINQRKEIAAKYYELLDGVGDIQLPEVKDDREHVWHLFVIRTKYRDDLRAYLSQHGIATVLNYPKALPFYKAYQHLAYKPEDLPVAYKHQYQIISLPIYPEMNNEQIIYVCKKIKEFFEDIFGVKDE